MVVMTPSATFRTVLRAVREPRRATTLSAVGLLLVTASWGSTFFMIKGVVSRVPSADFLALRFLVAFVALLAVAPRAASRLSVAERKYAVGLGAVYGGAQLLQTQGLVTTSASVSGFITGSYVVLTPVLGALVLRTRLSARAWTAVAIATAGLAFLSLQGLALSGGAAVTLASAVLYAVHILGLSRWTRSANAMGLSIVQLGVVTVVCSVAAAPGGIVLPSTGWDWAALGYTAVVAGALALLVQTWAQAHLTATRAAIIMTMEPVWAATFAVLLGGESPTLRLLLGGALVLSAMYLIELRPTRQRRVDHGRDTVRRAVPRARRPACRNATPGRPRRRVARR